MFLLAAVLFGVALPTTATTTEPVPLSSVTAQPAYDYDATSAHFADTAQATAAPFTAPPAVATAAYDDTATPAYFADIPRKPSATIEREREQTATATPAFFAVFEFTVAPGSTPYLVSAARAERYRTLLRGIQSRMNVAGTLDNAAKARIGELMGRAEMMEQEYLFKAYGKINASGHGIDQVFSHYATGDLALLESKFSGAFTAGSNPMNLLGRGYGAQQMSQPWVNAVIQEMRMSNPTLANELLNSPSLMQNRFMNVMNKSGESFFYQLP